jgi:4-alpha-glucanotransferase
MINNKKDVGTLLPLSALMAPINRHNKNNAFEIGYAFLEWLHKTHQTAWQLLPLHETQLETGSTTKHVPSPYKSYGVGLDPKYLFKSGDKNKNGQKEFITKHKDWIEDYALFCALRDHFGTDDWRMWDEGLVKRNDQALLSWAEKLKNKIDHYIMQQWHLHEAYRNLHAKAQSLGIYLIGDLPYYPSFKSPLVWAHQEVFQIDKDGRLPFVSGIPNTPGAHFGRQVWGHPLYNWEHHQEKVIAFWEMRLRYLSTIFDHMRFDHAKAFFSYGVIEIANPHNDRYVAGPGNGVFTSLVEFSQRLGLSIFVEDSGDRTEGVRKVLNDMHVPGLRIFRFSLKGDEIHGRYAGISGYPKESVAYTTTHDTETLLSYLQSLTTQQKHNLSGSCGVAYRLDDKAFALEIRKAIIASPSKMVIIPLQDWLLTTDRINVPGTEKEIDDPNWRYQLDIPIHTLPLSL